MNFLRKFGQKFYVIENKIPVKDLKLNKVLPLYDTEVSQYLESILSFEDLRKKSLEQQQDLIFKNFELQEFYRAIGPYQVYSSFTSLQNCFVIKAEYLQDNKLLRMEVMDVDGFYTKYISIEDLIPQTYDDYLAQYNFEVPYLDFINKNMIFKQDGSSKFFLFDKQGQWNSDTANLEDFDIRKIGSENKWLFEQIDW